MAAVLCCTGTLCGTAAATDIAIPDLREIQRENLQLKALLNEIDTATARRDAERQEAETRLASEELSLDATEISADDLRRARLELDSMQSRTAVVEGRIEQRTLALARIQKQTAQLERASAQDQDAAHATVADLRNEVARDLLIAQAELTERVVQAYRDALRVNRRFLALQYERLRLLQSRLRLDSLAGTALFAQDARIPLLESVIGDHLRRAVTLANDAAELDETDPAQAARQQALTMRVDDAATRSFLRQNDLELILAENALDDLQALRRDELMPLHVLREAAQRVEQVDQDLRRVATSLAAQRDVLASKRSALYRAAAESPPEAALLNDLETAIDLQQEDIERLQQRIDTERQTFTRKISERYAAALTEFRPLPSSAFDWRRLGENALHLPSLLARALAAVGETLRERAAAAAPVKNISLAMAAVGLVIAAFWTRRSLRRFSRAQPADSRLTSFSRPLYRVLPTLLPALLWLLLAIGYELPAAGLVPILLLLSLPPILGFVLALSRELLYTSARTPAPAAEQGAAMLAPAANGDRTQVENAAQPAPEGAEDAGATAAMAQRAEQTQQAVLRSSKHFYRRLRLGLLLATVIAALYILTRSLPVAPILADMLDRLAMLGVLALALPAFALHDLFSRHAEQRRSGQRLLMAAVASLSRLLPLFLLAVGLIGLVGYTELAWALLTYLGWAVVVGLLLAFVLGMLSDLRDRAVERLLPMHEEASTVQLDDDEEWDEPLEPTTETAAGQPPDAPKSEVANTADEETLAASAAMAAPAAAGKPPGEDLSDFWRSHFIEPGYRLAVLLALFGALWLLFSLWGWHKGTPVVNWLSAVAAAPLLQLGESSLSLSDLMLALLLLASVLYIGGWSQQVSYNLAYQRIRDAGLRQALATFTQYVIIVAGVLLALKVIGFDLTTLTVFAASLGVGIGFGLQNIINNFVSGVLLLAERPLKVGDFVSIGSNLGNVTRIGIRSLTMRTLDKQEVIIPNGSVISGEFTNWTRSDDVLRNVHIIRVRYEDDAELAMRLIERILRRHPHVLKDPGPGVFLWEYSESSVDIRVQYCFRMNEGPGGLAIRSEVLLEIGRRFRQHGIRMPHAQREVTMHLDEDSRGLLDGLAALPKPSV